MQAEKDKPLTTLGCRSQVVSLDAKRRFMVPLTFRQGLDNDQDGVYRFYIGFERDPCLYLHTETQHNEYVKGLAELFDDADEVERDALRAILASFGRVSTDAQGRLTLAEDYVGQAGLGKDLVLLANASRIEIWDPATFEARRTRALDEAWRRLDARRRERAMSHRGRLSGDRGEGNGPAA